MTELLGHLASEPGLPPDCARAEEKQALLLPVLGEPVSDLRAHTPVRPRGRRSQN